jgi:hypothetical protein
LLFGTREQKAEALAEADKELSMSALQSIPPKNPALERFRSARAIAAKAREILERKPK